MTNHNDKSPQKRQRGLMEAFIAAGLIIDALAWSLVAGLVVWFVTAP